VTEAWEVVELVIGTTVELTTATVVVFAVVVVNGSCNWVVGEATTVPSEVGSWTGASNLQTVAHRMNNPVVPLSALMTTSWTWLFVTGKVTMSGKPVREVDVVGKPSTVTIKGAELVLAE